MLDVAIIGGGLCGLALAHSLQARYLDWALFDARDRLGGRVLTRQAANGAALDLGPGWYWPAHQPSMSRLVEDLGLASFAQADEGRVLHLTDPQASPRTVAVGWQADGQLGPLPGAGGAADPAAQAEPGAVHGGARRVAGGMAQLILTLARPLPASRLFLGWRLHALEDRGDHVRLHLLQGEGSGLPTFTHVIQARRVVLALPPRLAQASLVFSPGLPGELETALRATPTWMACAAKAALASAQAPWRGQPHGGNAWVSHRQAVLAEVADASQPLPGGGWAPALAGFFALDAAQRRQFAASLALLVRNQFSQLFGPALDDPDTTELHLHDWAQDPFTATATDLVEDAAVGRPRTDYGHPLLLQPHWGSRLLFGGSETARLGGGYLEGALSAAARLKRQVLAPPPGAAATPATGA